MIFCIAMSYVCKVASFLKTLCIISWFKLGLGWQFYTYKFSGRIFMEQLVSVVILLTEIFQWFIFQQMEESHVNFYI